MTAKQTIQNLLAEASKPAERKDARAAWTRETAAACRKAQRQMDDLCLDAVDKLSEEEFEALVEAEQAKVDAIYAQPPPLLPRLPLRISRIARGL